LKERTIGETTYNIQSILLFFLILFLSGIISSIVTFFASSDQGVAGSREKKGGIGSWLLLIRISIITVSVCWWHLLLPGFLWTGWRSF
jgi:uncharacterized membrane protein YoaT (DUF817 family)